MTKTEHIIASRLLEMASDEFSNHCCNDLPDEIFEGISEEDLRKLTQELNNWNINSVIDENHSEWIPTNWIHDSSLMRYMAYLLRNENENIS